MRPNNTTQRHGSMLIMLACLVIALAQPAIATSGQGDDWCPRTPGYWKNHSSNWNTYSLQIGDATYDQNGMMNLLRYGGSDAASRLGRHLVATKLNLLEGSSSVIDSVVADADAFLGAFPPGSRPTGSDRDLANSIKDQLDSYNNNQGDNLCGEPPEVPGEPDENCVDRADGDQWGHHGGGHAMWLPGIGRDFVFDGKPGNLQEFADGTAQLSGIARRESNPAQAFAVDVQLSGFTRNAPAGSPKKELVSAAYSENGGPIDSSTWHYYSDFSGTLTGVDDFAGAVVEISQRGPAFQVGFGANGKSARYGASSWLTWWVHSQPYNGWIQTDGNGDFNLDLEHCTRVCIEESAPDLDYLSANLGVYAFILSGIGRDFVVSDAIDLVEYEGGRATVYGRVHSAANANAILDLRFEFSQRANSAPAGSPHLALPEMAYASLGGPISIGGWHYYQVLDGKMIGRGLYAGAEIEVSQTGAAFQVGFGASGRNTLFGASGWLAYTVVAQPHALSWDSSGTGDMTMNICPETVQQPMALPAGACFPGKAGKKGGVTGHGSAVEAERLNLANLRGAPDGMDRLNFVSLGYGGLVELEFEQAILNGPGTDLTVVETSFANKSCAQSPEAITVYAQSPDNYQWVDLGSLCQSGELDLGPLAETRVLLIVDISDPGDFFAGVAADGFDLDGVFGHQCAD